MSQETYYSLLKYVPKSAHDRMVVAGGWAACVELAGDIDIWLLRPKNVLPTEDWMETQRRKVHNHLSLMHVNLQALKSDDYSNSERALVAKFNATWEHSGGYNDRLTLLDRGIDVIVTSCTTAKELVNRFDISTHAVALQGSTFTFADRWTSIRQPPLVNRWDQPVKTLERLRKICQRYGIESDPAQITMLEEAVEAEAVVNGLATYGEQVKVAAA